ncbi:L,D-transpeptidase [Rhodosalinus halophilus]|uniref:L,D-transpeptidase n=1 Tax=Rhodosalinus halophilus TaxID=2259333 RepID=A0A365U6F1_9RHOB|nr:L,D-transpeptidase [Rhodosalinus halophilus]RBI84030.1 L,D-transpeptidase [Rhodosalinus halophilus]
MRAAPLVVAAFAAGLAGAVMAAAAVKLEARVDLSDQLMTVRLEGETIATWPVSTARPGKVTPTGTFRPQALSPDHRSTLYDGAPMPWSIFFHGNYAIHGTDQVDRLGAPASAGCIRLAPENARILFNLVREVGMDAVRIVIQP